MKRVQAGDVSYQEKSSANASHAKLNIDGVSAEKSLVQAQVSCIIFYIQSEYYFSTNKINWVNYFKRVVPNMPTG